VCGYGDSVTIIEAQVLMAKLAADPAVDDATFAEVPKLLFALPVADRRVLIKTAEFKAFFKQHGRRIMDFMPPPNLDSMMLVPEQARDSGHVFQMLKHLIAKLQSAGCDNQVSDQVVIDKLHAWEAQSGGLVHASVAMEELAVLRPFAVGFFVNDLTKASP
jgi:hypothetical protein